MPDYDYEEFDRRQAEWEERRAAEEAEGIVYKPKPAASEGSESKDEGGEVEEEDDMSW